VRRIKQKVNEVGKTSKKYSMVVIVLFILLLGGMWIGKYLYDKNNTICEASVYENNKQYNTNIAVTAKKEKKTEEEKNKEEFNVREELKQEEELKREEEKRRHRKEVNEAIGNNNYVVNVEEAYKKDGKKVAFLTFDDGPTTNITPEILDTLKKYDVKATFFVIGKMAEQNRDLIKKIVNEGHAIANHSYSHDYNKIYSSSENFWGEINKADAVLKDILGKEFNTRIFRFPGGSVGGNYNNFKAACKSTMKDKGYYYVDWNVENGDGKSSKFAPEKLLQYVKEEANGHEDIVVLMHDASTKKTTAEALPSIIEYLKTEGFEFKVLR